MSKFLYVATRVDIAEFLKGNNPTTQPGVTFDYYPSFSSAMNHLEDAQSTKYEKSMGDWKTVPDPRDACCVMAFEAENIRLQPNNTEQSVGSGALSPQHLAYSMVMMTNPSKLWKKAKNLFFEGTTWDDIRADIKEYQKSEFLKDGIQRCDKTYNAYLSSMAGRECEVSLCANKILGDSSLEVYMNASGTEQQRIITALHAEYNSPNEWEYAGMTPEDVFKEERTAIINEFSLENIRYDLNIYASMHFACLPSEIKDIAASIFDNKLYELITSEQIEEAINEQYDDLYDNPNYNREPNEYTNDIERCTSIAVAYAIESVLPVVEQQYPELLADVIDSGKDAMQTAIKLGASERDMVVENREDMILDNATPNNDLSDSFDEV